MRIRPAGPQDAQEILAVHVRSRRLAYEDFLPYEELFGDEDERRAEWAAALAPGSLVDVLVAERDDGAICAVASVGAARDEDRTGDGELYTLYVDTPAQGAGVGTLLHVKALEALAAGDYARAIVWCYAQNLHAQRFYEARGWWADPAPADHPYGCDTRLRIVLEP